MIEQDSEKPTTEQLNTAVDKHNANQQGDVIYVLRTAQQHHVMLGMIADQKANIILGAFLIFLTVTQKMSDQSAGYDISLWILTGFFTLSALFALMVIAPRFRNKQQTPKTRNLLFFGSFAAMERDEYIDLLNSELQDNQQARYLIMNDIYQIGQVLNKKYKNLRYSYIALALGITGSVISYALMQMLN